MTYLAAFLANALPGTIVVLLIERSRRRDERRGIK